MTIVFRTESVLGFAAPSHSRDYFERSAIPQTLDEASSGSRLDETSFARGRAS